MNELFVFHGSDAARLRALAEQKFHVTQEFSPKVIEIEGTPEDIKKFADAAKTDLWVGSEYNLSDQSEFHKHLTPTEKLCVEAWYLRSESAALTRPGDGANWGNPPRDNQPC